MDVFDLVARISVDTSDYNNQLNNAAASSNRLSSQSAETLSKTGKAIATAAAAATAAVAGFTAAAVKTGSEFDSSMSQVYATMGDKAKDMVEYNGKTVTSMEALRDFAKEMGSTTSFSASEAADALNYMALAGYDANTSMEVLPSVLNLAASGGIDLASASDMVTDALSALGKGSDYASTMVDQMAKTASSSNTSVDQLGEAILTIGATARNVKGGTVELSTVLGVLADNGIKGAEGGTHLRNMLLSLQNPTDAGATALKELGVAVYDADGNMRSTIDIMKELSVAMDGMSQDSKDAMLSGIFNKTDLAAANALLGTSADRFDELSAAIKDSTGAAEEMANTQLDNLGGDVTKLKSAFEGVQIALAEGVTPSLRTFVQSATEGLSNIDMTRISEAIAGVITSLAEFVNKIDIAAIIESVGNAIAFLVEHFNILAPAILTVVGAIEAYKVAMGIHNLITALSEVMTILTGATHAQAIAQGALNLVMSLNPIALVVIAIAGLVAAIVVLWNKSETFRNFVLEMWEAIKAAASSFFEAMKGVFESIANAVGSLKEKVSAGFNSIIQTFANVGAKFKEIGSNIVTGIWNGISAGWQWLKDKVAGLVDGLVGGVKSKLGIHSPSKVFAQIGDFMAQGLGEGWEDTGNKVIRDIEDDLDFTANDSSMASPNLSTVESTSSSASGKSANEENNDSGDIYIPVYLGSELLDTIIVNARDRVSYRSGGRVYA